MDLWEVYDDCESGRRFYVHSISKERTWKPPRSVPPKKDDKLISQLETSFEKLISTPKSTGAVQMRIKSANLQGDRLSQSKSMILESSGEVKKPISRHRRNHSQHCIPDKIIVNDMLISKNKEGLLNKTKITEKGKKLRKNWTTSYVVLSDHQLEFYKEHKESASNSKSGIKSEWIDLSGAKIEWAKEKSSRKNVFQITTLSGNEFLLQSDEDFAVLDWFRTIKNTIDSLGSEQRFSALGINIPKSSSTELLHVGPEVKDQKSEQRKSMLFKLNYSASDTCDRNRVRTRLKKFISRRPSLKTLQEKGLIKDQVFGCHLETLCKRENTTVPNFVKLCIEAVEKRGLDTDGVYRVSGNLSTIQKLRFVVNQEEKLNLDDSQWEDIHVVTGALKMFFRELPDRLFPYCFFEQFVEAIKVQDNDERVKAMRILVKMLPPSNHDTIKALFEHLRK
ncbi:rho GTPase-activating 15 [Pelobates cultripes]|uniref:Rho GTPase-activating protein 15 n=1 Tax=Pelobates cultripes TaxID=61616 RepID=A0AAD1SP10_PELCU|nr:rho GTPase-activating 15 [Pelobates cultripes]